MKTSHLIIICATVIFLIGGMIGANIYSRSLQHERDVLRHERDVIARTAPRPETAHERNVDRYLDRLVPNRNN